MADIIISVGAFLAKGLAIAFMFATCAAIFLVESRNLKEEA